MVIVDTNVLVYAVNENAAQHSAAAGWLESALDGAEAIGFAWQALLGFIRVSTLRAVFSNPLNLDTAMDLVDEWLATPPAVIVQPLPQHAKLVRGFLQATGTAGNLVSDAHLAALAIEHRASICSFDRDFLRFSGVRVVIPT